LKNVNLNHKIQYVAHAKHNIFAVISFKILNLLIGVFSFSERMYTDKHEWVLIDGKTGTVGISHYAQVSL
jgi:hypothetical protein